MVKTEDACQNKPSLSKRSSNFKGIKKIGKSEETPSNITTDCGQHSGRILEGQAKWALKANERSKKIGEKCQYEAKRTLSVGETTPKSNGGRPHICWKHRKQKSARLTETSGEVIIQHRDGQRHKYGSI